MANDFDIDVSQWVDKALSKATEAFRLTALLATDRIKQLTPVLTGNLRASWHDSLNNENVDSAAPGDASASAQLGDRINIGTNVVYARRVEYGFVGEGSLGRHYDQKGRGMMHQTIVELPQLAQKAVAAVRGGSGPQGTPAAPKTLGRNP
jgi:bacteriophage HK97-gp10 putative tail-component